MDGGIAGGGGVAVREIGDPGKVIRWEPPNLCDLPIHMVGCGGVGMAPLFNHQRKDVSRLDETLASLLLFVKTKQKRAASEKKEGVKTVL